MADLSQIQAPVQEHLRSFHKHFRRILKSKVLKLDLVIQYLVRQKGKQLRPMLVFLSAGLCGQINERTYRGAALVEMLHTATLIHDDIVDNAPQRRGLFSINHLWKNKVAVLAGDYLLSKGLLHALENKDYDFLQTLSEAVKHMSEGEMRQMEKSLEKNTKEEEYLHIIHQKTGSLLVACTHIGASSAFSASHKPAHEKQMASLRDYAYHIGLAFQIRDDILDYEGKATGKALGMDLSNHKLTLPLIYALQTCANKERKHMLSVVKKKTLSSKDLKYMKDFVSKTGGGAAAKATLSRFCRRAEQQLHSFPDSDYKTSLGELSKWMRLS